MSTPRWKPSVPVSSASQKTSFAYESTVKRWPTILTGCIDELARINGTLLDDKDADKLKESKEIINSIAGLIYEMRHDRALSPLVESGCPEDTDVYNSELAELKEEGRDKWFTTSWLYGECYMYRRLRSYFANSTHWKTFDIFATQKIGAFRSSARGVHALARSVEELTAKGKITDPVELENEWTKMLEVCLWGNATDLSLLTSLTHEDIEALQSVERGANFILKNDFAPTWEHVKSLKGARFDIVLDNSGFELYSDLVLADWLITLSPFCSEVVFHPKLLPWFVSDVQPHDFTLTLSSLLDPNFFPADSNITDEDKAALKAMVTRWNGYVKEGKFRLSTPLDLVMGEKGGELADFWTTPYPYSDLPEKDPVLLKELQKSSLVIFKGDLNYRQAPVSPTTDPQSLANLPTYSKLTSDGCWPTTTPFVDALGPLAGKFDLLSLRTCKADVCVGLEEGKSEELDKEDPTWRISGKYAVVSFVPKSA